VIGDDSGLIEVLIEAKLSRDFSGELFEDEDAIAEEESVEELERLSVELVMDEPDDVFGVGSGGGVQGFETIQMVEHQLGPLFHVNFRVGFCVSGRD
jgi:hypothetical protein